MTAMLFMFIMVIMVNLMTVVMPVVMAMIVMNVVPEVMMLDIGMVCAVWIRFIKAGNV